MLNEDHRTSDQTTAQIDYLKSVDTTGWWFITLTMKETNAGKRVDAIDASTAFRHFHNRLSQILLKNEYRKRKQKVKVIPIIECKNGRYHYHCAIENPTPYDDVFFQTVRRCWSKTPLGLPDTHRVRITDTNWCGYVLKTQSNNYNTVDWSNCYLGR